MVALAWLNGAIAPVPDTDPASPLHELTGWALEHGLQFETLEVSRPSLEDVYLEITRGQGDAE